MQYILKLQRGTLVVKLSRKLLTRKSMRKPADRTQNTK